MFKWLKCKILRDARDESGGATVEFVLLFPGLLLVLGVLMDVSFMYYTKAQILATVQDVARDRSIGGHQTDLETKTLLDAALSARFTDEAVITTSSIGGVVSTQVSVPLHDMQIVGFFATLVGDFNVNVGTQQYVEWWDVEAPEATGVTVGLGEPDPVMY